MLNILHINTKFEIRNTKQILITKYSNYGLTILGMSLEYSNRQLSRNADVLAI
jgi:hypothetical protein